MPEIRLLGEQRMARAPDAAGPQPAPRALELLAHLVLHAGPRRPGRGSPASSGPAGGLTPQAQLPATGIRRGPVAGSRTAPGPGFDGPVAGPSATRTEAVPPAGTCTICTSGA